MKERQRITGKHKGAHWRNWKQHRKLTRKAFKKADCTVYTDDVVNFTAFY